MDVGAVLLIPCALDYRIGFMIAEAQLLRCDEEAKSAL
jgi:hypothetical protein